MLAPPRREESPARPPDNFAELVESEVTRICRALTRALFTLAEDNILERLIRHHQRATIDLADQLSAQMQNSSSRADGDLRRELLSKHFISELLRLLDYFERYFPSYFNTDQKVPQAYGIIVLGELADRAAQLCSAFKLGIKSQALLSCLLDYLSPFFDDRRPPGISYREAAYLKIFVRELEAALSRSEGEVDAKVSETLFLINFNHLGFFLYCQQQVKNELEFPDTKSGYIAILSTWLSLIRSFEARPGLAYHPEWPPVKQMMETWLKGELETAMAGATYLNPPLSAAGDEEKMELQLSVSQIACLARLFYEENVYPDASVTDLLLFISRHYRSKRQEHISPKSLSKEYYGVSQVTAAVIRDLLSRMVTRINKVYFPVWAAACVVYYCF